MSGWLGVNTQETSARPRTGVPAAVKTTDPANEDTIDAAFLNQFLRQAGGRTARIVIISCAATNPARTGEAHAARLRELGAGEARWLQIWQRWDANSELAVTMLEGATGILITGGDQARLLRLLAWTRALETIRRRHGEGIAVAAVGASAALLAPLPEQGGSASGGHPTGPEHAALGELAAAADVTGSRSEPVEWSGF